MSQPDCGSCIHGEVCRYRESVAEIALAIKTLNEKDPKIKATGGSIECLHLVRSSYLERSE